MKRFVFLMHGFKTPTPEIMTAWRTWFETVKDNTVEMIGLGSGREISKVGIRDLPLGPDSITGLMVVNAESFEAAQKMAEDNPFITSIRVYEIRLALSFPARPSATLVTRRGATAKAISRTPHKRPLAC